MADSGILKLALKLSVTGCHCSVNLQSEKKIEVLSEDAIETQCAVIRAKKELVFIGPYTFIFILLLLSCFARHCSPEKGKGDTRPPDLCLYLEFVCALPCHADLL